MLLKRVVSIAVILCALWSIGGCHKFFTARSGGDTPTASTAKFVYVALAPVGGIGTVAAYSMNQSDGRLTLVGSVPVPISGEPQGIAVDPAGTMVFASTADTALSQGGISVLKINRNDGSVAVLNETSEIGWNPYESVIDPNGKFIYTISKDKKTLTVYQIQSTGELGTGGSFSFGSATPISLKMDSTGRLLYVTCGVDGTYVFTVDASTGTATRTGVSAKDSSLSSQGIAITPGGHFAYVSNGQTVGGVDAYSVNAHDGLLTLIGTTTTTGGKQPGAIAVDPSGKYLYVVNTGSNNVAEFTINADGTLTALTGSPVGVGGAPGSIAVDPEGLFVYVTNSDSNKVSILRIGSGGALAAVDSVDTASSPVAVVVSK